MKKTIFILCSIAMLSSAMAKEPSPEFLEESGKFHYKYIKAIEQKNEEQKGKDKIAYQYYNLCYEKMESEVRLIGTTKFKIFTCSCFANKMSNFAYEADEDSIKYFLESDKNKTEIFDRFIKECSIKFQEYNPWRDYHD